MSRHENQKFKLCLDLLLVKLSIYFIKERAFQAIKKLLEMEAKTARVIKDGEEKEVPIEEVQIGDV